MVFFVLFIGLIIQRYCIRYLAGDRSYRKYFMLFTLTTSFAAMAWLTGDIRIMVISWGCTLIGLTLLISLTSAWRVTRAAAIVTGKLFFLGWIALASADQCLVKIWNQYINYISGYGTSCTVAIPKMVD